jgi:hypothetical protein
VEGSEDLRRRYLDEQLALADLTAQALHYSYETADAFPLTDLEALEPPRVERLEALAARFARLADLMTQKVFRAVDAVELVDEGSLLDRLARMEKRGVIDSEATWRDIRDLRNQVAHDYVVTDLERLYSDVYAHTPELIASVGRVRAYLERSRREPD